MFFSCDKGADGAFIKKPGYWHFEKKKICTFILDCDKSDGSSKECATNIEYSMKKFKAGLANDNVVDHKIYFADTVPSSLVNYFDFTCTFDHPNH